MNTHTSTQKAEIPTSESIARHRRQSFWQIFVPIGFGVLVILVILGLVIVEAVNAGAEGGVSQWANTSIIWLSLPSLMFAFLLAIILIGMVYLLASLLKVLPGFTANLQSYVALGKEYIGIYADKLVAPIIAVKSASATVSALFGSIFGYRRD